MKPRWILAVAAGLVSGASISALAATPKFDGQARNIAGRSFGQGRRYRRMGQQ